MLPALLCAGCLAGGIWGPRVEAADASEGPGQTVSSFTKAYALVEQNFAEPLNADASIYKGAIPGMLRTLDPHSNFFDPRDYQILREDQRGHYYGVGMQVGARNGMTVVIAPFPGSPAYKAGLRPGDTIETVDSKPVAHLSTTEVADLLKGDRGSPVTITVARVGAADPLKFDLVRDEIQRKSVEDPFWVEPGIAYVRILQFGEGTGKELEDGLKRLGEGNINGLILDLRDNPGGLLNEGVAVADHFLAKSQLIVSQHGRASAERPYVAREGNHGRDYPIVALVNRGTASAAEIVSGSLQDHDRAWIMGEITFGKGLVQTVFPLQEGTGLALTTAHFYTPSGRLIQRDYTNKPFYEYYYNRAGMRQDPSDVKTTDGGRTVYGGGGITPDQKYETPKMDSLESELYRDGLFEFTRSYFSKHSTDLPKDWMPSADTVEDLHDFLLSKGRQFTEAQFTTDHDWIERNLAREMYTTAFNVDVATQMFDKTDPEVHRAVEAMPQAEALLKASQKTVARREAARPSASEAAAVK
ncbi:MAG TPA: S41 family peptidase [Bryobacteraceae bacterium]|nr:S41 family peptidase [Bryobacteraceae bacterium]